MSADRWSICPKCPKDMEEIHLDLEENEVINLMFGEEGSGETLREDWEIGQPNIVGITVRYSCSCSVCGWKHGFTYSPKFVELTKCT